MNIELNSELTPPTLKNKHIYLRTAKLSDFNSIRAYRQDPQNCRYIRPPESDKVTFNIVEQLTKPWVFTLGHWNGFVICLAGNDTAVGEIVFRVEDWDSQRAEIGYRLSSEVAGQGVCSQAAELLIDYLFTQLGFFKIVAKCDPRNIASYKVMEKLGFKREAHFKDHYLMAEEWTDQYDYGLLASQWRT